MFPQQGFQCSAYFDLPNLSLETFKLEQTREGTTLEGSGRARFGSRAKARRVPTLNPKPETIEMDRDVLDALKKYAHWVPICHSQTRGGSEI